MKSLLLISIIIISQLSFSQNGKMITGYNYLKDGNLTKAKEMLDAVILHPKTKEKAKAWQYRGETYYQICLSIKPEYIGLIENPYKTAFESFVKASKLDKKDYYSSKNDQKLLILQNYSLNKGVELFNKKSYTLAASIFTTSVNIAKHQGKSDSLAIFNVALACERGENFNKAIEYYNKSIKLNYKAESCCSFIIHLLQKQGKQEEAYKQIKFCRNKFPNDYNLLINELNYLLKNNEHEKAKKSINEAIKIDPENSTLYYSAGSIYEQLKLTDKAKTSYKKAISINPSYFDAYYNLGALHFNKGVETYNKANQIDDFKEAKQLENEANLSFTKAIPFLEKANKLKPKDLSTLIALKEVYARSNNTIKYKEVNTEIKALKGY
jgi:tetratricopeptide (TPR) repeat protein